jgi:hypothetical protein
LTSSSHARNAATLERIGVEETRPGRCPVGQYAVQYVVPLTASGCLPQRGQGS